MTALTDADLDRLFDAAKAAQAKAYAPYSSFRVGAAVLDEAGRVHSGCNVENAAYPLGACAEANALGAMAMAGGRRLLAALVLGEGEALVTPCGGCRQRLREFGHDATPILIAGPAGIRVRFTLGELLPAAFGPDNLATPGAPGMDAP